jgi:hypothetical protein
VLSASYSRLLPATCLLLPCYLYLTMAVGAWMLSAAAEDMNLREADGEVNTHAAAERVLRLLRLGQLGPLCFDSHPLISPPPIRRGRGSPLQHGRKREVV